MEIKEMDEIYEAPECKVVEMEPMQVLCSSGFGNHDGFGEDNYGW